MDLSARLAELTRQAAAVMEVQSRGLAVSAAFELLGREPPRKEEPPPLPTIEHKCSTHHIGEYLHVIDDSRQQVPAELMGERRPAPYNGDPLSEVIQKIDEANQVKLYPGLGVEAFTRGEHAGLALWYMARSLDRVGRGVVGLSELKHYTKSLGMCGESFKRARRMALELGMMTAGELHSEKVLKLASLERLARRYGGQLSTLGAVPVMVPARMCASLVDFKAACWGAFLEGRNKQLGPISRDKLEEITQVPRRTQHDMERRAGVRVRANFARSRVPAEDPNFVEGAREYRPGAFVINHGKRQDLAWHMPNSYSAFRRGRRGMMRKINGLLKYDLLNSGGRVAERARPARIFWNDREHAERQREKPEGGRPEMAGKLSERYFRTSWTTRNGAGIWQLVQK